MSNISRPILLLATLMVVGSLGAGCGWYAMKRRAAAVRAKPPAVERIRDISYFEGLASDADRHRLDLYLPRGRGPFPVMLFIHGGSWTSGGKEDFRGLGERFAGEGIVLAVMNYRLSPGVKHPAHIQDVARAFAWVKQHIAAHGGDPADIFVCGHSSGGHLAALLGADESYLKAEGCTFADLRGVIPISGEYRIQKGRWPEVFGDDPATARAASPMEHVDGPRPPFLILHASEDSPRVARDSRDFRDRLLRFGGEAQSIEIPDRTHVSLIRQLADPGDPAAKLVVEFIQRRRPGQAQSTRIFRP